MKGKKQSSPIEEATRCSRKAEPVYHTSLGSFTVREVVICVLFVLGCFSIPWAMSITKLAGWW